MVLATISWSCYFKVEAQLVWNFSPDRLEPCASPALTAAEDRKLQADTGLWVIAAQGRAAATFQLFPDCPTSLLCHPFTECCLCKQKLDYDYCKSSEKDGKALISWHHRAFNPKLPMKSRSFVPLRDDSKTRMKRVSWDSQMQFCASPHYQLKHPPSAQSWMCADWIHFLCYLCVISFCKDSCSQRMVWAICHSAEDQATHHSIPGFLQGC